MLYNAFLLAIREIRRNVLRSFLTILGIVIGVAAVIIMVTIGSGATQKVTQDIEKMGSNLLMARPGQRRGPGGSSGGAGPFNLKDFFAVSAAVSPYAHTAPSAAKSVNAIYTNLNWATRITGTTNDFLTVRSWDLEKGRVFTDAELTAGKTVCIIGATIRKQLFGNTDPLGEFLRLDKLSCQVVGLLAEKGQTGMGADQDDTILIPLRTFQRRISGSQDIDMILISVKNETLIQKVQNTITLLLRERRNITALKEDDFFVMDMKEISDTLTETTRVLTALLGAVAAVSLLVGGIGIMNIMLVSVTERTREIGTRLAIGALEREVLLQFLVEAVVLSLFGGIVGIFLAVFTSMGLCRILKLPFVLGPGIITIAFFFSAAVGVVFGYFPAKKAAQLDPIEALRYE
jgi:putative ABC transport system permease protein